MGALGGEDAVHSSYRNEQPVYITILGSAAREGEAPAEPSTNRVGGRGSCRVEGAQQELRPPFDMPHDRG